MQLSIARLSRSIIINLSFSSIGLTVGNRLYYAVEWIK